MKKILKKKLIAFALVFVFVLIGTANVYAAEPGEHEIIKVVDHTDGSESSIDVRYIENKPYVKLDDIYCFMSPDGISINNTAPGIYVITTLNGKATLNTVEDTLNSADYGAFIEIPEEETENLLVVTNTQKQVSGDLKEKNIDFKKYGIDIIGEDENVWLPVRTAFDMFLFPGFYDGKAINVYNHTTAAALIDNYADYNKMISGFFIDDMRANDNITASYNELCFMFDHYYGYPEQCILCESIKQNGLDHTLEHYDNDTRQIKQWLLSDNINDYYKGLAALDAYLYDGGHTVLSGYVPMYIGFFRAFNLDEEIEYIEQVRNKDSTYDSSMDIEANRKNALTDNYIEKGDTSLYAFDSFEYDAEGWENYYKDKAEYPDDTLGGILKALDKASRNKNIKYFVFDISNNTGGMGELAPVIMDFLGYENCLQYRDTLNNLIEQNIIDTDINFDGIYDKEDKISKYHFNYGVLTSKVTYSTANIFASIAKENNFMILGEKSGGGACSLSLLFTNESLLYTMSSTKHIVNNAFDSIDSGIDVDKNLIGKKSDEFGEETDDYSKYYDIDYLSELLNEYYASDEKGTTESEATAVTEPTAPTETPKTGDDLTILITLLMISILCIAGTAINITKEKKIR